MRKLFITAILLTCTLTMLGQGVMDVLPALSGQVQGTARYSSMAGAFGALGGDLTTIRQNPAGIGVYRSSEATVTAGFNFFNNTVETPSHVSKNNDFYFTGDNMGLVGVINFRSGALRNLNFGFAYNNIANFNNKFSADWSNIDQSLTQLIAGKTSAGGFTPSELSLHGIYNNPYNTNLPWMSVLAYNTNLISISTNNNYAGIFGPATRGNAYLDFYSSGSIDEYDFNISGNVLDKLYWGLTINVTNINYRLESYYGEELTNAQVADNSSSSTATSQTNGGYELRNLLHTDGYGAGVKLGLIYRPHPYFRIGLAFHSPTFYNLSDTYSGAVGYSFDKVNGSRLYGNMDDIDNQTDIGSIYYNLSTPCHYLASVAAVIGKLGMISFDYEYIDSKRTKYSGGYYSYQYENKMISEQLKGIHNLRAGLEIRVTPSFSLRAGYAYESAPMDEKYFNGITTPQLTESTIAHYQVPADAHNFSCGLGYRINNFFIDAAYVHRKQMYSIHPFEQNVSDYQFTTMDMRHNSIKATIGFRF